MNTKTNYRAIDIAIDGMMIALVFLGTFYFKIPSLFGYTHLGDCMIILAVCLLGTKRGALAGGIGAGLADLLGGYTAWVLPTMAFKATWAIVMGFIAYKLLRNNKYAFWIGSIAGGIIHIILYTGIKIPMFGLAYAFSTLLTLTAQTISGIVLGNLLYLLLRGRIKAFM